MHQAFAKFSKCNNKKKTGWNDERLLSNTACCSEVYIMAHEDDNTDVNALCTYTLIFTATHGMSKSFVTPAEA
jgi:hypothetical protein